jgi:predicted HicB family RNase H-like nuclease
MSDNNRGKYTGFTEARKKANSKYLNEKVDTVSVRMPKGKKEKLLQIAEAENISINQTINSAIDEYISKKASNR